MPVKSVAEHYGIDGDRLEWQYKDHLSGYREWRQKEHAEEWLLFPENMGGMLSIDETAPSQGELYTIVSNKEAHNGKGSIVSVVRGTRSEDVHTATPTVLCRVFFYSHREGIISCRERQKKSCNCLWR